MLSNDERKFILQLLELFTAVSQIPITLYEQDSDGTVSFSQAYDRGNWLTNICQAEIVTEFHPLIINGKIKAVLQYGASRKTEELLKKDDDLLPIPTPNEEEKFRLNIMPILTNILHWYLESREDQAYVQNAAFHDVQMRLQAALAGAEDLLTDMKLEVDSVPESLIRSADTLVDSIEATGTVLLNVVRGIYLPKEYRFKPHSLREIIGKAISLCRPLANKKGISFNEEYSPNRGKFSLQASELHLQQAFNNLLHNAVKYSYETSPNSDPRFVIVRTMFQDSGWKVIIQNYGIGIEQDEFDKIFEGGTKGRLQSHEYRTGSGHGLALTKRIIEAHHGHISVQSRPAGNSQEVPRPYLTEFTVWLPLNPAATARILSMK